MNVLTTERLRHACRIFLDLAYPHGPASMPEKVRLFSDIPANANIDRYLLPSPIGVCQAIVEDRGYRFRLGCAGFRHLKLVVQRVPLHGESEWLYSVDTHDSWHQPDMPDADLWVAMQHANRELKSRIEKAWAAEELLTQNGLLRLELADSASLHLGRTPIMSSSLSRI